MKKEKAFKYMLGLFAGCLTILLTIFTLVFVVKFVESMYEQHYKEAHCYDPDCSLSEYLAKNIYYHNMDDEKGYIFNSQTKEKIIRNVLWIARPEETDSFVCFCDGKKRGYFNKYTGEVVIPAKYEHAWVFSEGLASVDEDGCIKFINGLGETVIDNVTSYRPEMDGLLFHGGYCVVDNNGAETCCLIDKSGRTVLPQEYSEITPFYNYELWRVSKGEKQGVYDSQMNPVIPLMDGTINVYENEICVTMLDHTMRKYNLKGKLIHDFYIVGVRDLEYEKPEIINRPPSANVVSDDITEVIDENIRPKAIARMRAYTAGNNYDGLMTREGHIVTKPLYENIEAIGPDLYLCTVSNEDKIVVNGKGDIMK